MLITIYMNKDNEFLLPVANLDKNYSGVLNP